MMRIRVEVMVPIMFCLRCGYRREAQGSDKPTKKDRAHLKRCDYTMTIRYVLPNGRITGGVRR